MAKKRKNEKERIGDAMRRALYTEMAAQGCAPGIGSRARTIQSKRDKARDPRRQRREWRAEAA